MRGRRRPPAEAFRRWTGRAGAAVAGLDTLMGVVGGALFFVVAWYIVFDVVGRNYTGWYSRATDEISGYALAMGTTWAMAFTLRRKGHVTVDLLVARLPARAQEVLALMALLVMGVFAVALAWFTWSLALGSFRMGATSTGMIGTPLVVPQTLMALGFTTLAVEAVVLLLVGLAGLLAPAADRAGARP